MEQDNGRPGSAKAALGGPKHVRRQLGARHGLVHHDFGAGRELLPIRNGRMDGKEQQKAQPKASGLSSQPGQRKTHFIRGSFRRGSSDTDLPCAKFPQRNRRCEVLVRNWL